MDSGRRPRSVEWIQTLRDRVHRFNAAKVALVIRHGQTLVSRLREHADLCGGTPQRFAPVGLEVCLAHEPTPREIG